MDMNKRGTFYTIPIFVVCALLYYISSHFDGFPSINTCTDIIFERPQNTFSKPGTFKSDYVNSRSMYNWSKKSKFPRGVHELLWWNEPGWIKDEHFYEHCETLYCKYSNCILSWNKSRIEQSSAVIISIVDPGTSDLPFNKRNFNQPWVFFSLESPNNYGYDADIKWRNVFNWSMTYHRDADIFIPYGRLEDRIPPYKDYSAIFRRKSKQAAWILSHCQTSSLRENYIKILQKYIQVDVFGGCGTPIQRDEASLLKVLPDYKFYLGFENAFCRDYVTEKYFRYFKFDLILVVRGLADYNTVFPQRTFINTADFKTIDSLGKYLQRLMDNEDEYIEYLKTKDAYRSYDHYLTYCDALCTLCEKVNNLPETRKTYETITPWSGKCQRPTDIH